MPALTPESLRALKGDRKVFIETGSAYGSGIQAAIGARFDEIWSIEAHPERARDVQRRYRRRPQVRIVWGRSEAEFPRLLKNIKRPAVIWLDAVQSGGRLPGMAANVSPAPIIQELEALAAHPIRDHLILINNMKQYEDRKPEWNHISKDDVLQQIELGLADYRVRDGRNALGPRVLILGEVDGRPDAPER